MSDSKLKKLRNLFSTATIALFVSCGSGPDGQHGTIGIHVNNANVEKTSIPVNPNTNTLTHKLT